MTENLKVKKILVFFAHTLFWVISYYLISNFIGLERIEIEVIDGQEKIIRETNLNALIRLLAGLPFKMILFYAVSFFFFPKLIKNQGYGFSIVYLGSFFFLLLVSEFLIIEILFNRHVELNDIVENSEIYFNFFSIETFIYIYFLACAILYALFNLFTQNEKQRKKLQDEKLETELNFLKSQLNPHFLFNTLNNLYSIAEQNEIRELSTGISELANLMRYMIYESNIDKVPLTKELSYLESYIEIEQLRISEDDDILVNLKTEGDISSVTIAPVLLFPFIENAFKHGINLKERSIIDIRIKVERGILYFIVKNKIFRLRKDPESSNGIGLSNVKRRLELLYPDKHQLSTSVESGYFIVNLELKLNSNA